LRVFRQKRLAELAGAIRVAALQEGRYPTESGIDVHGLFPGTVAFLRSVLTSSPGFLKAPLVFSIHRSRPC
jgi:hypothetical protein